MSLDVAAVSPDAIPGTAPSVGATVWLTGLPSAGKTTITFALAQRLRDEGRAVEVLDGDAVRAILAPELGYSRTDRDMNVARIGWVARLLARHGVLALASVVSPFAAARDGVRAEHDVKGLYARQRTGALSGLTGIDGEYEPPSDPELRVDTSGRSVDDVVDELIALLRKENLA